MKHEESPQWGLFVLRTAISMLEEKTLRIENLEKTIKELNRQKKYDKEEIERLLGTIHEWDEERDALRKIFAIISIVLGSVALIMAIVHF